jgi:hypothetical protein
MSLNVSELRLVSRDVSSIASSARTVPRAVIIFCRWLSQLRSNTFFIHQSLPRLARHDISRREEIYITKKGAFTINEQSFDRSLMTVTSTYPLHSNYYSRTILESFRVVLYPGRSSLSYGGSDISWRHSLEEEFSQENSSPHAVYRTVYI